MAEIRLPPGGIRAPLDKQVSSVFAAGLAYGLYLSTLLFTVRWLLFADEGWKRRKHINWPMVFVTSLIFVMCTAYTALGLKSIMDAVHLLITKPSTAYANPMWMSVALCFFANTVALSADLVLIYRCYVVYMKSLRAIAFPCLLWSGGFVCTILQMYLQIAHMHNPNLGPYVWASVNMVVGPGIVLIPFWGSTMLLNLYCTTMLLWRLYRASEQSETSAAIRQFRFVARGIAESGFIYLSISFAHFVVWFTYDNFAIQIISVLNVPLIGIAFDLILIRAAHSRAELDRKVDAEFTSIQFSTNPSIGLASHIVKPKMLDAESRMTDSPDHTSFS